MNRLSKVTKQFTRRKYRVRATVSGTAERPRLAVRVSRQHVTAQIIDDIKHKTLAYSTTVGQKSLPINMTEKAVWTGTDIAKKAKSAKISRVVFDRGGKLYHGRIKALADAARENGLEF